MLKDSPQGHGKMDVEEETPATRQAKSIPIPQELVVSLPLLTLRMSPFNGLVNRPLEPIEGRLYFSRQLLLSR